MASLPLWGSRRPDLYLFFFLILLSFLCSAETEEGSPRSGVWTWRTLSKSALQERRAPGAVGSWRDQPTEDVRIPSVVWPPCPVFTPTLRRTLLSLALLFAGRETGAERFRVTEGGWVGCGPGELWVERAQGHCPG